MCFYFFFVYKKFKFQKTYSSLIMFNSRKKTIQLHHKKMMPKAKLIVVSLFFTISISAQDSREGKDFALFFAVDNYLDTSWSDLEHPIDEVEEIADYLKDYYAFDVETHKNPTRSKIENVLKEWQKRSFPEGAQLFVFFSGHGHFSEFNDYSYFVPQDGKKEMTQGYYALHEIRKIVDKIEVKHILLGVDACYSGALLTLTDPERGLRKPTHPWRDNRELTIQVQLRDTSRLMITSGGKERTPAHSKFAGAILTGLRKANVEGDGLFTYNSLLGELDRVIPVPRKGRFGKDEGGGFIFVAPRIPLDSSFMEFDTSFTFTEMKDGKTWMTENLNYKYIDSHCYDEKIEHCISYGRLYTWEAAQNVCRELGFEWRLPTDIEWQELAKSYGGYFYSGDLGDPEEAFTQLRRGGSSGFGAVPGGWSISGELGSRIGSAGSYWTSTESDLEKAWSYVFGTGKLQRTEFRKSVACSVRCVKNN